MPARAAESTPKNGIAHFIEHMVFKGTSRRTAEQIAREMDSVGGLLDAFTSKESVCFNAKVLDEHTYRWPSTSSPDMVLRPLFADEDIAKEKQVILEEIRMEEDNPESVVHETLTQNFWRGHPLGAPILGTRSSVQRFNRRAVLECFRPWYAPNHVVITAAGALEPQRLFDMVGEAFGTLEPQRPAARGAAPTPHARLITRNNPALEQAHITVAVPSFPLTDPRRFGISLLSNILGGGMSSRLFQNVRERQGPGLRRLQQELTPYSDAGMLSIYAGTARQNIPKVLALVAEELRRFKQEPVSPEELRRAKDQIKGSLLLSARIHRDAHVQIWRARRCISAGSSPSTRSLPPSKPIDPRAVQEIARRILPH